MSSSADTTPRPPSWQDVDRDLGLLAYALEVEQSPSEAQFHAALDELALDGWPIPTEAEALAWADRKATLL